VVRGKFPRAIRDKRKIAKKPPNAIEKKVKIRETGTKACNTAH
jgi:hypothetical protein